MILKGFTNTIDKNIVSFHPSLRNWCNEMVEILWEDDWDFRYLISLTLQSISGLCNLNHGNHKTIRCYGLLVILNDIIHAKLCTTTWSGSDSSTIFPEAIGRPSMTTTKTGQWIFLRDILWTLVKFLSMKQELTLVFRSAKTCTRGLFIVLTSTWASIEKWNH